LGESSYSSQQTKARSAIIPCCCLYLQGNFLIVHVTLCDSKQACYIRIFSCLQCFSAGCASLQKSRPFHPQGYVKYRRDTKTMEAREFLIYKFNKDKSLVIVASEQKKKERECQCDERPADSATKLSFLLGQRHSFKTVSSPPRIRTNHV